MVENQRRNTALARRLATCVWFVIGLSLVCSRAAAQNASGEAVRKDYAAIVDTLRPFIEREMSEKGLPALSIAIVDDQEIVWAQGFGTADPKQESLPRRRRCTGSGQFPNFSPTSPSCSLSSGAS